MSKVLVSILNLGSFIFLMVASFIFSNRENMFNVNEVNPIFMPSGYAFSIWILIYILLAIWILKSFFCDGDICEMYKKTVKFFVPCLIFTGLTVIVPTKLSNLFITLALITAIFTYLEVFKSGVSGIYKVPFSFLVGWLFVATIVNLMLLFKSNGWFKVYNLNELTTAIVALGIGAIIAIIFALAMRDNIVLLVMIWAYVAIAVKNFRLPGIVIMVIGMCGLIIIAIFCNMYKSKLKE